MTWRFNWIAILCFLYNVITIIYIHCIGITSQIRHLRLNYHDKSRVIWLMDWVIYHAMFIWSTQNHRTKRLYSFQRIPFAVSFQRMLIKRAELQEMIRRAIVAIVISAANTIPTACTYVSLGGVKNWISRLVPTLFVQPWPLWGDSGPRLIFPLYPPRIFPLLFGEKYIPRDTTHLSSSLFIYIDRLISCSCIRRRIGYELTINLHRDYGKKHS